MEKMSWPWWLPGCFRLLSEGMGLALEPSQSLLRHVLQPLGAYRMRSDGFGRRWNCKIVFWRAPGGAGIAKMVFWRVPGGVGIAK